MKAEYLKEIEDLVKLRILPPFKTSNDHHDIECLICGGKFNATPKAKLTRFRKHGMEKKSIRQTVEKTNHHPDGC